MNFKKFSSILFGAALSACLLAGCGNSAETADKSSAKQTDVTSVTTSASSADKTTTTVTVNNADDENSSTPAEAETSLLTEATTPSEKPDVTTSSKKSDKATSTSRNTSTAVKITSTKKSSSTNKPTAEKVTSKTIATVGKTTTTTEKAPTVVPPPSDQKPVRNMSTQDIVNDMGVGINLGNTFDSCGSWINSSSVKNYETAWGSCEITEKIIKGYKNAGFGVIRVPVAWSNMMGADYQINKDYINRVKQVVNWIIENDMYAVVNIHWDGGWINNYNDSGMSFSKTYDKCKKKYTAMWTTLCEEFKDYNDYLVFESLNEEGCWDDLWNRWGGTKGKTDAYALLNDINQMFVDVVRSSGGNNPKRHLLIAGYGTDIDLTCDKLFKMPSDPAKHCAVSVHYYTPSTFCILEEDADWGKASSTWGTASEVKALERSFDKLKTTFTDKGIPVIIGEYGCPLKNKELSSVRKFISTVSREAVERNICPILWDTFDRNNPTKCFYNRNTCKINDSVIAENFLELSK